jgi:hypothetical protein
MSETYLGSEPADHTTAQAASVEWGERIKPDIDPARVGLAKAAMFALFRLSYRERRAVFGVFCRECGDHVKRCQCLNDE